MQKHNFHLMAIVIFSLSLTISKIFAKQEKCRNFDLENDGQGIEEQELCHLTANVRIHIGELFQNFSYLVTYVYAKGNTHRARDYQQNLLCRIA